MDQNQQTIPVTAGEPPCSTKKIVTGAYVITEQPLPKFFKDEGGKKNCLIAWVKVHNLKIDGTEVDFGPDTKIPTLASICYESGESVEEKHQYIFTVANGEEGSRVFSVPANGMATRLLFRIEKVSRRFDSRKFIVKLSACEPGAADNCDFRQLDATATTPIEVFSKRKVKNIDPGESFGHVRPRTSELCKRVDLEQVEAEFTEEFRELREMFRMQQSQMDSVMNLLESRKSLRSSTKPHDPAERVRAMAGAGVLRPPSLLGMDRLAAPEVAFNFGPPTPIAAPALDPHRRR